MSSRIAKILKCTHLALGYNHNPCSLVEESMFLMDGGLVVLLVLSLGTIIFVIQRTEAKRRRIVLMVMFLVLLVLGWLVNIRGAWGEAVVGLLIALFLNGLFYVLIGRYNPVGSSDDIHVLGMDD